MEWKIIETKLSDGSPVWAVTNGEVLIPAVEYAGALILQETLEDYSVGGVAIAMKSSYPFPVANGMTNTSLKK